MGRKKKLLIFLAKNLRDCAHENMDIATKGKSQ